VNASSVPAVNIQVRMVPMVAVTQVAPTRVQNDEVSTPGTTLRARCIATACPAIAIVATASQPMAVASLTSTGRIRTPNTPVTAAAITSRHGDEASNPDSSPSATMSPRELIAQVRARRARSETRSLLSMTSVSIDVAATRVTHRG
jgi:hypothetical protein